jgi:hypothetical protein
MQQKQPCEMIQRDSSKTRARCWISRVVMSTACDDWLSEVEPERTTSKGKSDFRVSCHVVFRYLIYKLQNLSISTPLSHRHRHRHLTSQTEITNNPHHAEQATQAHQSHATTATIVNGRRTSSTIITLINTRKGGSCVINPPNCHRVK